MPSDLLTQLYNAYKDWCAINHLNPDSAHRLYSSVWEILRVSPGCCRAYSSSQKPVLSLSKGTPIHPKLWQVWQVWQKCGRFNFKTATRIPKLA